MLTVTADWRTSEVRRLMDKLRAPKLNRALSVAVNQSARQVKSLAASKVAEGMGLRVKDVSGAIHIRPFSTPATLEATVRGRGVPLPLVKFGARQTRKGVSANSWGERKVYPGSFLATMPSGHQGVFKRVGPKVQVQRGRYAGMKRQRIEEMWGAGVAQVMAKAAVSSALEVTAIERLQANVLRQLDRYTRNQGNA